MREEHRNATDRQWVGAGLVLLADLVDEHGGKRTKVRLATSQVRLATKLNNWGPQRAVGVRGPLLQGFCSHVFSTVRDLDRVFCNRPRSKTPGVRRPW